MLSALVETIGEEKTTIEENDGLKGKNTYDIWNLHENVGIADDNSSAAFVI